MGLIDRVRGILYHPVYIYTNKASQEVSLKEKYIFVYSKNIYSIKDNFYGNLSLFKAGCRSYLERVEIASDSYIYRLSDNITMLHVLLHNLFNKNKIAIINGCVDFPVFSYTTGSYMVDNKEQMENFPYKFKGQLFFCSNISRYFYYFNNEFIETDCCDTKYYTH